MYVSKRCKKRSLRERGSHDRWVVRLSIGKSFAFGQNFARVCLLLFRRGITTTTDPMPARLLKPVSRLLRRTNPSNCMLDPKAHGRLRYFETVEEIHVRSSVLTISADLFAHREVVSSNTLVFHFSGETELLKRAIEEVVYTIRFCRFYLILEG